jgi:hypothetical protein
LRAITTTYLKATAHRPNRIRARAGDASLTLPAKDNEGEHARVALALCVIQGWYANDHSYGPTHLVAGQARGGYVFVFARHPEGREGQYWLPARPWVDGQNKWQG